MDWHQLTAYVPDVIQIFILYLVIYAILKGARGSRFGQVLMGSFVLFALLIAFTRVFHFGEPGVCGPVSRKLYETLRGIQDGVLPDTHGWCFIVK